MSCTMMLVIVCDKYTTTAKNIRHYLLAHVIPPISSIDWQVILPCLMLCFRIVVSVKEHKCFRCHCPFLHGLFCTAGMLGLIHKVMHIRLRLLLSFFFFFFVNFSFAKHINRVNVGLLLGRICIHPLQFIQTIWTFHNLKDTCRYMYKSCH